MLKAGFILLTIAIGIVVYMGAAATVELGFDTVRKRRQFKAGTALFVIIWPAYAGVLSYLGFFLDPSLPGRIPIFLVLPCLITMSVFFISPRYRKLIDAVPLSWLIYFQSFRIGVELLLFGLFMEHMVPWTVTFEGYNFDIGIGMTAPIIGYLAAKGRLYKWFIVSWNVLGLLTIFTVAAIINIYAYRPWLLNETTTILGKGFGTFPITYFASCFLPSAIFMHVFALIKTSRIPVRNDYL